MFNVLISKQCCTDIGERVSSYLLDSNSIPILYNVRASAAERLAAFSPIDILTLTERKGAWV